MVAHGGQKGNICQERPDIGILRIKEFRGSGRLKGPVRNQVANRYGEDLEPGIGSVSGNDLAGDCIVNGRIQARITVCEEFQPIVRAVWSGKERSGHIARIPDNTIVNLDTWR